MDKIIIKDLQVFAYHGVLAAEKELGQKFLVSATLYLDTRKAGKSDEIYDTIDYGCICKEITDYMKEEKYNLIEAVAEGLCEKLLIEYSNLLKEITLSIKKPWAPVGLPVEYCQVCIHRKWHDACLSLGSNKGDKKGYISEAITDIGRNDKVIVNEISTAITTKPYGGVAQDDFKNAALYIKTLFDPIELLEFCNELEQKAGRTREIHWGPRTLDIDIIFYDNEVISMEEPNLIIPHVDMQNRLFVLEPLNEIVPWYVHPLFKKTVRTLYEDLKERTKPE